MGVRLWVGCGSVVLVMGLGCGSGGGRGWVGCGSDVARMWVGCGMWLGCASRAASAIDWLSAAAAMTGAWDALYLDPWCIAVEYVVSIWCLT